ncbi:predicted protein [Aspergillus terreus NIH2624]|uniref:Hydroxymethyltransferase n=1 Tax=Aspergillus terreus (strain NIH 2624 / FGSC A1156) TaxID=341663 RepID=Q0CWU6_ASPTN|nr:uncharacterized protein ATEG_01838 [Aspergillus terreus NIH2624]EAU38595.1 predicted protein [Aspergillus terreus NIH2624]
MSEPQRIEYDASLAAGANPNYAQVVVTNLHYTNGGGVPVNNFLGVVFLAPVEGQRLAFWAQTDPWVEVTEELVSSERLDANTFAITMRLNVETPHTFGPGGKDVLNFGVNGDITNNTDRYLESFIFATDAIPDVNGTVIVRVDAAPDPALADQQQELIFTPGERAIPVTVPLNETTNVPLPPGTYTVTASALSTPDQTTTATAQVSPGTITVSTGETTSLNVIYGAVEHFATIDVVIGPIPDLADEELGITVNTEGGILTGAHVRPGGYMRFPNIPPDGFATVGLDPITLNNIRRSWRPKEIQLSPVLQRVNFSQADMIVSDIDTTGFVELPVAVRTDVTALSVLVPVRIEYSASTGPNPPTPAAPTGLIYTQSVPVQAGRSSFAVPVAPGIYSVQVTGFFHDGVVYAVTAPRELTVAADGTTVLELQVQRGANMQVRGFPNFLNFGGCTKLVPTDRADFVSARASSIFIYAGVSGDGDPEVNLPDDVQTRRLIELAREVEADLNDGNPVLPVLISYTCNLSVGDARTRLGNELWLEHSFGNFILALGIARGSIDERHPVPAGFVVNPDFIGACQQDGITADFVMPVREPLQNALTYRAVEANIPDAIDDTLKGYILAVNWLVRTVAPEVTFGWQINLWGVGTSFWLYDNGNEPRENAIQTAEFTRSLGVFDTQAINMAPPDFMAIDRYEADDFTYRGYGNSYCYGPREWARFFDFCQAYSLNMAVPVMPWQIPASHIPLVTDVVDDLERQHWGTGGSYIFGDPRIGSDYHQVNPDILQLKFLDAFPFMGKTAEDTFIRSEPFDITNPAYEDFVFRGIFAVLLGGGSTTGIVSSIGDPSPWVRERIRAYMEHPIPLSSGTRRSRE